MKYQITITGKNAEDLAVGQKIKLVKEPGNDYDNEAIRVMDGRDDIGYAANSYKTRNPETISASRLLDKIPNEVEAVIVRESRDGLYPIAEAEGKE